MRWILFTILVYLCLTAQVTLASLVMIRWESVGAIIPDLAAIVAVFFALSLRNPLDVLIVCWALGLGMDLTAMGGGGELAVVGPMPLAYAAAGWIIYKLREAFFRDKVFSQMILAMIFCLLAHGLWVTVQSLIAVKSTTWEMFGQMLLQALLLATYTAVFAPPLCALLRRCEPLLLTPRGGRTGRER